MDIRGARQALIALAAWMSLLAPLAAAGQPAAAESTAIDSSAASSREERLTALVEGVESGSGAYAVPWHVETRRGAPVRDRFGQVRYVQDLPLPLCALTYDMEHGPARAADLLAQLERADVRATSFWLGSVAAGQLDLVRAWRAAGHAPGLHSWGHEHQPRLSLSKFRSGTERIAELLRSATGSDGPGLYRFPWGEATASQVGLLRDLGYTAFYWSVDTSDYLGKSGARVAASGSQCQRGGIVLMHDTRGAVDGAAGLAKGLRAKGLEPVAVHDLLGAFPAQPCFALVGVVRRLPGPPIGRPEPGEPQLSIDGGWAALVREGSLGLWDRTVDAGVCLANDAVRCAWSPVGDLLAVEASDGAVYVLSATAAAAEAAGRPTGTVARIPSAVRVSPPGSVARAPAFAPDGGALEWERLSAGGSPERVCASVRRVRPWGVVRVVSDAPGAEIEVGAAGSARTVATPCLLIAGGKDNTLRLRAATGEPLTVRVECGAVATLRLTGDGLHRLEPGGAPAEAAPARAPRDL